MNQESLNQIFGPINLIITLHFFSSHPPDKFRDTKIWQRSLLTLSLSNFFFQPVCHIIRAISLLSSHSDSTTFPHVRVKELVMWRRNLLWWRIIRLAGALIDWRIFRQKVTLPGSSQKIIHTHTHTYAIDSCLQISSIKLHLIKLSNYFSTLIFST